MSDCHHAIMSVGPLHLSLGQTLPEVKVAYAHYGTLAPDGRNAILVGHGYTASHRMLAHGSGVAEGSWSSLIGPGRPLDTDRFFIICSNMLGSCYGSTGPGCVDPRTGQRYGADFPAITLADIVAVQHRLLQRLGVQHLRAVIGPSFGGFQALQWAISHPQDVDAIGVVLSGTYLPRTEHTRIDALRRRFEQDPAWNGGRGATRETLFGTLLQLRLDTMATYGASAVLAARGGTAAELEIQSQAQAAAWAREFEPHSLFVLLEAAHAFDARPHLVDVRADVLYVVSDTDVLFPPDPSMQKALAQTGSKRPLRHVRLCTDFGHMASGAAPELWGDALADLLAPR